MKDYTGDPRFELLIRDSPYSLHSQRCPVNTTMPAAHKGMPGTSSACDCWRRRDVEEMLARLDAVDPLRVEHG